jgi:hypothetical protein
MDMAAFSYAQKTTDEALMKKLVARYSKPKTNTGREISALLEEIKSKEVSE